MQSVALLEVPPTQRNGDFKASEKKAKKKTNEFKDITITLKREDVEIVEFAHKLGGVSLQEFIAGAVTREVEILKDKFQQATRKK